MRPLQLLLGLALLTSTAPALADGKAATLRLPDGRVFTHVGSAIPGGRHTVREVIGPDGKVYIAKSRDARRPNARREAAILEHLERRGVRRVPRAIGFVYDQPSGNDATLIMTRSPGRSLASWFDGADRPSAVQMARVVAAAARVVHQAHRAAGAFDGGTAHVDLKPGNIMVVDPTATRPKVEVIDWETAQEIDHHVVGDEFTDNYAAPEMWIRRPRTARADVYSLGKTLEHMVTGRLPFGRGAAPRLAGVPRGLAAIIAKATAPDPKDRHASADALARALTAWANAR